MLHRKLRLMLFGILFVWPLAAHGAVVTFAMKGTIDEKNDRAGLFDFADVGDQVIYTYTFDTLARDTNGTPKIARYAGIAGSLRVESPVGVLKTTFPTSIPDMWVQLQNNYSVDSKATLSNQEVVNTFELWDDDNTAITTKALLPVPYPLDPFEIRFFQLGAFFVPPVPPDGGYTYVSLRGHITDFVPEPASLALLAGLGLSILRRRS